MRTAVTILARAPEPGRVKTRLAASVGALVATGLHEAMALDVIATVAAWAAPGCAVLALTGEASAAAGLASAATRAGLTVEPQGEGSLGDRMALVVRRRLAEGAGAVLLLGTDAPLVGPDLLDAAAQALASVDVVLAPAQDGGYVLFGARCELGEALADVPWGSASVLRDSRRGLAVAGFSAAEVSSGDDVDDLAGLLRLEQRLLADPVGAPQARAFLRTWRRSPTGSAAPPLR